MNTASSRSRTRIPVFFAVALAGGAAFWFLFVHDTPHPPPVIDEPEEPLVSDPSTPDPRLTFPTAFRNVKPEIQYLGDASCAGCHSKIDKTFHMHPMGQSAGFVARFPPIEKYDSTARSSFTIGGYELRVEKTASGMVHHVAARDSTGQPLPEYTISADLAIGSGTRGRSYLSLQNGAVWQTPISWFSSTGQWDLSPGFDLGSGGRRAIIAECLFCHVDRVELVSGAVNRYREPLLPVQPSIGCERCHGPGALHVAERTAGPPTIGAPDTSIVNPKHLPPDLRASVCAQCHLQGQERVVRRGRDLSEFRPGLPLEQFVTVFVRHTDLTDLQRSVGQFEQIERSRCFTSSIGRLGCTSCHDPHEVPAKEAKLGVYRGKCLTCHKSGAKECSTPARDREAKADACTACHMLSVGSSNIAHASVTDHRILRRPSASTPPRGLAPGVSPLIAFSNSPYSPSAPERDRDLGIALVRVLGKTPQAATRGILEGLATDRLNLSLKTWRGDVDGWMALSLSRAVEGEVSESRKAAVNALALAPESEAALTAEADTAIAVGDFEAAVRAATKLIEWNPTAVEPRMARAIAFVRLKDWAKAEEDCRQALRIHPLSPRMRLVLAVCLNRQGDPMGGRKQAETAAGLVSTPQERTAFLDWYREQTR